MKMPPGLKAKFEAAERRDRFWADNYPRLLVEYPEQYVAAKDQEIVAAEATLEELLESLEELGLSPHGDVWMQWVSKSMRCLVL